ncbi:MAG: hypothetical protein IPG81_33455 [Sandaracinaceae bacterium]|nr:hypothetical protein [Sandaracinaceae bacterium]
MGLREVLNLLGAGESLAGSARVPSRHACWARCAPPLDQPGLRRLPARPSSGRRARGRFDVRSDRAFRRARAIHAIVKLTPRLAVAARVLGGRRLRAAHAALDAF